MKNMDLWNSVCKTDPSHTKEVSFGRKFTAIDAHYQIQRATETFGPFGLKWGVREERFALLLDDTLIHYTAILWYDYERSFGEIPIHSGAQVKVKTKAGQSTDDDCFKKAATDALTKGLSKLGFNADVFLGQFDDNKYVQQMKQEFSAPAQQPAGPATISQQDLDQLKSDVLGHRLNAQAFYKHMGVQNAGQIKKADLPKAQKWISEQVDLAAKAAEDAT